MSRLMALITLLLFVGAILMIAATPPEPDVNYGFFNYYCDPEAGHLERAIDFLGVIFANVIALAIAIFLVVAIVGAILGGRAGGDVGDVVELLGIITGIGATIFAATAAFAGITTASCNAATRLVEPTFALGSSSATEISREVSAVIKIDESAVQNLQLDQALGYLRAVQQKRPRVTYLSYPISSDELRARKFSEKWCDFRSNGEFVEMGWEYGRIGERSYEFGTDVVRSKETVINIWEITNVGPAISLFWVPSDELGDYAGGFDGKRLRRCVVAAYRMKPRYAKMVLGVLVSLAKIGVSRTFWGKGYCETRRWDQGRVICKDWNQPP